MKITGTVLLVLSAVMPFLKSLNTSGIVPMACDFVANMTTPLAIVLLGHRFISALEVSTKVGGVK
jgi:hypothetical protein